VPNLSSPIRIRVVAVPQVSVSAGGGGTLEATVLRLQATTPADDAARGVMGRLLGSAVKASRGLLRLPGGGDGSRVVALEWDHTTAHLLVLVRRASLHPSPG
jgi:hypothetical protein